MCLLKATSVSTDLESMSAEKNLAIDGRFTTKVGQVWSVVGRHGIMNVRTLQSTGSM